MSIHFSGKHDVYANLGVGLMHAHDFEQNKRSGVDANIFPARDALHAAVDDADFFSAIAEPDESGIEGLRTIASNTEALGCTHREISLSSFAPFGRILLAFAQEKAEATGQPDPTEALRKFLRKIMPDAI